MRTPSLAGRRLCPGLSLGSARGLLRPSSHRFLVFLPLPSLAPSRPWALKGGAQRSILAPTSHALLRARRIAGTVNIYCHPEKANTARCRCQLPRARSRHDLGGQPGGGHTSKGPCRVDAGGPDPSLGVPARSAGASAPPPLHVRTVPRGTDAQGSEPAVGGRSQPLDPHGHSRATRRAGHGGRPLSAPRAGEAQVPRAARTGLQFPEGAEPGPGRVAEPRSVGQAAVGGMRAPGSRGLWGSKGRRTGDPV